MKDKDGKEFRAEVPRTLYKCFDPECGVAAGITWVDERGECLFCGSKNLGKYVRVALVVDATAGISVNDPECGN